MRPAFVAMLVYVAAAASLRTDPPKEVTLNVVADDGHGRLVGDLDRVEFRVFEDGKEQTITSFQRREEKGPHPLLVLLDLLNTQFGPRGQAVDQIVTALQRLESAEEVYLYVLSSDGALRAVHAMPDTPENQERTLWTRSFRARLSQVIADANSMRPEYLRNGSTRADLSYRALTWLAARLARFPGRKAIVWVTHGVPLSAANLSGSSVRYEWFLQRLAAVLGQAEIAGYAVAQSAESRLPDTMYSLSALETLRLFADLTGGRMYPTDHIDEALIQALADAQLSYRVGYQPPSGKADTEYRKLRVVCLRHGVQVQSRQGYYPNWGVPRRP